MGRTGVEITGCNVATVQVAQPGVMGHDDHSDDRTAAPDRSASRLPVITDVCEPDEAVIRAHACSGLSPVRELAYRLGLISDD